MYCSCAAKNVILAGVKSVTLHDAGEATLRDLSAQFYLTKAGHILLALLPPCPALLPASTACIRPCQHAHATLAMRMCACMLGGVNARLQQGRVGVARPDVRGWAQADVGRNRAQACRDKLQELNTAVAVTASSAPLTPEFLSTFKVCGPLTWHLNHAAQKLPGEVSTAQWF